MAKRWGLQGKFKGRRGGVTVSVLGRDAGRPEVARVSETLFGDEVIEGDHWSQWAGRGKYLRQIAEKKETQLIASVQEEPMVHDVEARVLPVKGEIDPMPTVARVKNERPVEPVRARTDDGHFVADDPSTPTINEAFDPPKMIRPQMDMTRDELEDLATGWGIDGSALKFKKDIVDAIGAKMDLQESRPVLRKKRTRKKKK